MSRHDRIALLVGAGVVLAVALLMVEQRIGAEVGVSPALVGFVFALGAHAVLQQKPGTAS